MGCAEMVGGGRRVEIMDRLGFEDPVSAHILAILSDEDVLGEPGVRLLADRALDLLCLQLMRRHNAGALSGEHIVRGGLASWQLARLTDYMLEYLSQPIAWEELASLVSLSRYHFCTAFRISTGRTPHVWLTEQRMARACQLLGDRALSVSEIALAVGYATPSAFTANFRRVLGKTASCFRRPL